jgi:hypothetical protein
VSSQASFHFCADLQAAADAFVSPHLCADPLSEQRVDVLRRAGWSAAFHLPACNSGVRATWFVNGQCSIVNVRLGSAEPPLSDDDAAGDGLSLAQLADLAQWYRGLKDSEMFPHFGSVYITGYPDASSLIVAFQQLHPLEIDQAIVVSDGASAWSTSRGWLLAQRLAAHRRVAAQGTVRSER